MPQDKYFRGNDTCNDSIYFPVGFTVAMKREEGGLWTNRMIVKGGNADHKGQSYTVRVTKMGSLITHKTRQIVKTPIMTKKDLREQITKDTGCLENIFTNTNFIKC